VNTDDALMTMAADKMAEMREQGIRLRSALGSIYEHSTRLTGREAVQALLDSGALKQEDLKP